MIGFRFNKILLLFNLLQVFVSIQLYELFNQCGLGLSLKSLSVVAWDLGFGTWGLGTYCNYVCWPGLPNYFTKFSLFTKVKSKSMIHTVRSTFLFCYINQQDWMHGSSWRTFLCKEDAFLSEKHLPFGLLDLIWAY